MLPPAVMWIDPGMDTGLAVLLKGRDFYADEFRFMEAAGAISYTCQVYREQLWIGWERYDIDRRLPQQDAHHATEMIGVARREAMENGCRILAPSQQHTPTALDRQRLQAIGWWRPGKDDAQSAACHLLAYLLRTNEVPPRERAILDQLRERA